MGSEVAAQVPAGLDDSHTSGDSTTSQAGTFLWLNSLKNKFSGRGATRQALVVLFAAIPVIIVFLVGFYVPIPYVAEGPGVTFNVLGVNGNNTPIISITGADRAVNRAKLRGKLLMTTVSIIPSLTLWEGLELWGRKNEQILPKSLFYPANKTSKQVDSENKKMFSDSQENSSSAALKYMHLDPAKVHVSIDLPDIGGPSAGLMFALGIVDKLGTEDLTDGKVIAGTGEIDHDGHVREIGGITLKLRAATEAGSAIFLVPAGNCAEALTDVPQGLTLVKVSTLQGAIDALEAIKQGHAGPSC